VFVHFAFGELGKQGKVKEQTDVIIECILKGKRLKMSRCTEFIPRFPKPGAKRIPMEMFKETENGMAATFYPREDPDWFNKLPDDDSIYYSQRDVPMVCFIKIAFNQLKASNHCMEYGKFGIVLTEKFLRLKGIRQVKYYTEESLWSDPLINKWNFELESLSSEKRRDLEKEILSYRKPATYFPTFKSSVVAKIMGAPSGRAVEFIKYDRYDEGYDFTKEHEYRIVFDEGVDYLDFEESNLFMVITPDTNSRRAVQDFFSHNWREKPQVLIYPS
jgi:hypothetical protein